MEPGGDVTTTQYLTFGLAGEEYAIEVRHVREIIEYDGTTRVPQTPAWIKGVINLRGGVVPVVDLAVKLGLDERPVTRRTCVVIVEVTLARDRVLMGVMADAVSQVIDVAARDVEPVPVFGTKIRVDYLTGMSRDGKRFVLLLDIDRVLAAEALLAASEPAPEREAAQP